MMAQSFRDPCPQPEPITCPLCGAAMRYEHVRDHPDTHVTGGTHVYTCPLCPAVLFEYWVPQDVDNLARFLKDAGIY